MAGNGRPFLLMAFANVDESRPLGSLEREQRGISTALAPLVDKGRLDTSQVIEHASLEAIAAVFRSPEHRGRVRVFHYGGHADADMLLLADDDGKPGPGYGPGLADLLGRQNGLELVVLNGCSTRDHIERLHSAGVRAVVATCCNVMDDVAASFSSNLYSLLASGVPLESAFDETSAFLRGKRGQDPRAFVYSDSAATPDWSDDWPWILSCNGASKQWTLLEQINEHELADHLTMVISDQATAQIILGRLGFP